MANRQKNLHESLGLMCQHLIPLHVSFCSPLYEINYFWLKQFDTNFSLFPKPQPKPPHPRRHSWRTSACTGAAESWGPAARRRSATWRWRCARRGPGPRCAARGARARAKGKRSLAADGVPEAELDRHVVGVWWPFSW